MELETTSCPQIIGEEKCGLPAEILQRYDLPDSEGVAMSHVVTLCVNLHSLHGPETMLPQATSALETTED